MAIEAKITGNLLSNPVSKPVKTPRGEVKITEFRMMNDVWKAGKEKDDEPTQDEAKTKPVQITVWNERLAEAVAKNLRAGMRVEVHGDVYLSENRASDDDRAAGKRDYADLRCDASTVSLMLNRVEGITMRQRAEQAATAG
jgi:single-stranded DNA-binding protein